MRTVRRVSVTGRIDSSDHLVSPVTGRAVAAIRVALVEEVASPKVCWLGRTIVVRARMGAIRVELATARLLRAQRQEPCRVPEDVAVEHVRPFAGRMCEVIELFRGASVGLTAPIRLSQSVEHDGPTWETCAALGPVVLTLL